MNISVIIPVHEFNETLSNYLDNAVQSVINQEDVDSIPKIFIVHPPQIENVLKEFVEKQYVKYKDKEIPNETITLIKNTQKTDYQSQVNFAVDYVTTDYFSVLEFDDEYSNSFMKNASIYIETYPQIDIFLTMMIETNEKNQGLKFTNEIVWSQQFVGENGEMGYLNLKSIKQYSDFKLSGAVIKKSEFKNIGGYKSNIKLTFMYEYLLRALNNSCKIYTIPKIGYKHLQTRKDSLFDMYSKTMSMKERKFWFDVANKESNFTNDRVIDTSMLEK